MTFFYDLNKRLAALADKQDLHESKVAESEKWIQKAVNPANKGGLHKALHVAQDKKIPKAKIEKATHSKNPKLRHMAQFAKNVANEEMADEGNAFTGKLASTPKGGNFKLGDKTFKDTSSIEEGHCPTCDCAPCECNEGNAFSKAVVDAKRDGIQKGEKISVGGKELPLKELDMRLLKGAQGSMKGSNTDTESERNKHKKYGYRSDRDDTGNDDDYDEHGNLKNKKKAAASDGPKKKGRPASAKSKDEERVTKGSHKYKTVDGKRVKKEKTKEDLDADGVMMTRPTNCSMEDIENEGWRGGMHGEPSVVKTGKKDPNAKVEAWNGLMAIVARGQGMEPAILKHLKQIARTLKPEELELDEEKVEAGKREFFDRLAPAAKKAAKVIKAIAKHRTPVEEESTDKEDTRAERAGKKVAKDIEYDKDHKGKDDNKAEKAGKKVTKDIEYDDKKDREEKKDNKEEKVDETTVSGSVATATPSGKSSKGGMSFGKGVYENINNSIEKMISESISIESTMKECGDGNMEPGITIQADGEDAAKLMMLLKLAGLENQIPKACPTCGGSPCGCAEVVDENSPDWPTNTETLAADPNLRTYSGGLNGPKSTGQSTTPVLASQLRRQASMEESVALERNLFKTWQNYKG